MFKKVQESFDLQRERRIINDKSKFSIEYAVYLIKCYPEILAAFLIETNTLFISYPFNTIKTRIQSRHFNEDVAFFKKNKVEKSSKFNLI